ncbi:MAG: hypothetical protein AB1489_00820 [Acidobacteriota bacterium]
MTLNKRLLVTALFILSAPLIDTNAWLFALQDKTNGQTITTFRQAQPGDDLAAEVRKLTQEIRRLHASQRRMLDVLLLQIEQGHAEKLDDKLAGVESQLRNLTAREANLEKRLSNISGELAARNILNRIEGERIVRAELQAELDQVRAERQRLEPQQRRLNEQVEDVNRRLDLIRGRILLQGDENLTTEDVSLPETGDKAIDKEGPTPPTLRRK